MPDTFTGFPNSAAGTVIPNAFFSRVLPEISDPAELVVSAYVFFALGLRRRRQPRFVTLRELEADAGLARALANLCGNDDRLPLARPPQAEERGPGGEGALARGLDLAAARGTLVRATSGDETLYTTNMPANVRGLERLAAEGCRSSNLCHPRNEGQRPTSSRCTKRTSAASPR